ncbi:MAG: zf-HC2 domain-containing protein [Chitinophagaceae bacterium]|nr:zf-HC2 domain-containing protein [Rubrivivax sp.]
MKLKLDCKAISRLLSDGMEDTLPAAERTRMQLHFVMCQSCRNVREQMDFLRRAMRQIDRDAPSKDGPRA